jgi:hypothetical protein
MEKVRNIRLFKNYFKDFYVAQTKVPRIPKEDTETAFEGNQTGRSN